MQQQDSIVIRYGMEKDLDVFFEIYWNAIQNCAKNNGEFSRLKSKEQCKYSIINCQRESEKDNNFVFLVAVEHDKIIGIAKGNKRKRENSDIYQIESVGYINSLYVLPEYQQSEIGKRLVERLTDELFQKGLDCIEVHVPLKDQTIDLYSSLGFVYKNIVLLKGKTKQIIQEKQDMKEGNGLIRHNPYGRGKATIPFVVKVKPTSLMGDYIALHGLVPQNELPEHLRHQIPEDEIWIREDIYEDPIRRDQILFGHEKFELNLMETKGLTYKQAHRIAELHEQVYKIEEELGRMQDDLRIKPYEPVKLIVETVDTKKKEELSNGMLDPQK